jgi:hypothetical protein
MRVCQNGKHNLPTTCSISGAASIGVASARALTLYVSALQQEKRHE